MMIARVRRVTIARYLAGILFGAAIACACSRSGAQDCVALSDDDLPGVYIVLGEDSARGMIILDIDSDQTFTEKQVTYRGSDQIIRKGRWQRASDGPEGSVVFTNAWLAVWAWENRPAAERTVGASSPFVLRRCGDATYLQLAGDDNPTIRLIKTK
jgi:hypothetical protein